MEGCIGFALGAMYYGEIEIKGGRAQQRNFDSYRSLRIHAIARLGGPRVRRLPLTRSGLVAT